MSVVITDEALSAWTMVHELNQTIKSVVSAVGRAQQFATEVVYRNTNRHLKSLAKLVDELRIQRDTMEECPDFEKLSWAITRAENILSANPPFSNTQAFLSRAAGNGGSDPGWGSPINRPIHFETIQANTNRGSSLCSDGPIFQPNQALRNLPDRQDIASSFDNSFHTLSGMTSPSRQSSIAPSNSASQVGNRDACRAKPTR